MSTTGNPKINHPYDGADVPDQPNKGSTSMSNNEELWTKGEWTVGMMPGVEIGGKVVSEGGPMRDNDGSFKIGAGHEEDRTPVGTAAFRGSAKRGEGYRTPDPEGLANAHLMAASKEMYAALKQCLAGLRYAERGEGNSEMAAKMRADIEMGEAALSKARGE